MDERRRQPRVELRSPGSIDLGDHAVPCQLLNLSSKGLALVTGIEPPLRAVRVRFRLGDEQAGWAEVDAMAVRSETWVDNRRCTVWGMRMCTPDPGTRTRVRGYIASKLRN